MRKLADSSWLIAHGSWYLVVNDLTRLWTIGYGLLARVFIICVQLVRESREKQWDIYPQKCSYAGISGSHRQTLPSCTQDYPKFTRIVSALFYTPILRKLTDIIRTFSTLSTPPTITTTIYI